MSIDDNTSSKRPYTVPITGKFAPGNPGKPKGTRHMSTLLDEAIKRVAKGSKEAADIQIVRRVIEKAKAGDNTMIEHVWDRLEGKAPQKLEVETVGEIEGLKDEIEELNTKFNEFLKSS